MNKTTPCLLLLIIFFCLTLPGCGGKYRIDVRPEFNLADYETGCIVKNRHSEIKYSSFFPSSTVDSRGNIAEILREEIERYGVRTTIVDESETVKTYYRDLDIEDYSAIPEDIELIILYKDVWGWGTLGHYLKSLKIKFIENKSKTTIAIAEFHNEKEFHDFPSPEREIPGIIESIFETPGPTISTAP